ncbi:MAG: hypothetical protein OXC17_06600 [Aestuariivita sp.]|nr:hypothetical protein [Aestuariivita sp.]
MAAAQMWLAKTSQIGATGNMLGEKSEAFEDSAVAEVHCVFHKLFVIAIIAPQIGCEAVGYMLDVATDRRVVEHVDDRSMYVGDRYPRPMVPDILRGEDLPLINVLQREGRAVPLLVLLTRGLRAHHEDVLEYLFGQVPVLGCRSTPDVGRRKERGNKHPWVIKDAIRSHGVDRSRDIGTTAHSSQPSLFSLAGQTLGGTGSVELEGNHHVIDVHDVAGLGQHLEKLGASSGKLGYAFFHTHFLA